MYYSVLYIFNQADLTDWRMAVLHYFEEGFRVKKKI